MYGSHAGLIFALTFPPTGKIDQNVKAATINVATPIKT
jgi:hypothetical protein